MGKKKLKGNKHVTQHTMDWEFSGKKKRDTILYTNILHFSYMPMTQY